MPERLECKVLQKSVLYKYTYFYIGYAYIESTQLELPLCSRFTLTVRPIYRHRHHHHHQLFTLRHKRCSHNVALLDRWWMYWVYYKTFELIGRSMLIYMMDSVTTNYKDTKQFARWRHRVATTLTAVRQMALWSLSAGGGGTRSEAHADLFVYACGAWRQHRRFVVLFPVGRWLRPLTSRLAARTDQLANFWSAEISRSVDVADPELFLVFNFKNRFTFNLYLFL